MPSACFRVTWIILFDILIADFVLVCVLWELNRDQLCSNDYNNIHGILLFWLMRSMQATSGVVYILYQASTARAEYARLLQTITAKYRRLGGESPSPEILETYARAAVNERNEIMARTRAVIHPALRLWAQHSKPVGKEFEDLRKEVMDVLYGRESNFYDHHADEQVKVRLWALTLTTRCVC